MKENSFLRLINKRNNLKYEAGIWVNQQADRISYPHQGNDDLFFLEDESFWFKHRNDCIKTVVKNFDPHTPILDVGGGNGFVTQGLNNAGYETFLLEPGSDGVRNAQRRGVNTIIQSQFEAVDFVNASIPAVGLFDVLEHIEDDREYLNTINSKLQNGGYLFLTVPAYDFLWSNEDVYGGHFRRYTVKDLHLLLESLNFKVKYKTYIFSILIPPIFVLRVIPSYFSKPFDLVSAKNNLKVNSNVMAEMMKPCWRMELAFIRKLKKIPFGSTCLMVAQKA